MATSILCLLIACMYAIKLFHNLTCVIIWAIHLLNISFLSFATSKERFAICNEQTINGYRTMVHVRGVFSELCLSVLLTNTLYPSFQASSLKKRQVINK